MPFSSFGRDVKARIAAWSIPRLKSWIPLGRPILALEYLRTELKPMPKKIVVYRLRVTSPDPADVARHELHRTIGGAELPNIDFVDGDEISIDDGAEYSLFAVDYDRAGNPSTPSPVVSGTASAPDLDGPGQPTLMLEFVRVEMIDE